MSREERSAGRRELGWFVGIKELNPHPHPPPALPAPKEGRFWGGDRKQDPKAASLPLLVLPSQSDPKGMDALNPTTNDLKYFINQLQGLLTDAPGIEGNFWGCARVERNFLGYTRVWRVFWGCTKVWRVFGGLYQGLKGVFGAVPGFEGFFGTVPGVEVGFWGCTRV